MQCIFTLKACWKPRYLHHLKVLKAQKDADVKHKSTEATIILHLPTYSFSAAALKGCMWCKTQMHLGKYMCR